MRKNKTVNGVTTSHIWDGQNVVEDITNGNKTKYLRGINLISLQSNNNTYYYHFDGHGDTKYLTDNSNEIFVNYEYDAFGNQLENTDNSNLNPFRYNGEYYDAETGNIYLRARYYDSETGRFITEDPIRDGYNWYVYCGNNPIMFVDPLGLFGENTFLQIGTPFNNPDVIKLQRTLNDLGYVGENGHPLTVDGDFGANTEYAVKQFQTNNKLQVDGIVGKNTWSALGLKIDYSNEHYRVKKGYPEMYIEVFSMNDDYMEATFDISNGKFVLGASTRANLLRFASENDNCDWNIDMGNIDLNASIATTGFEIGAGVSALEIASEYSAKLPTGYTVGMRAGVTLGGIGLKIDADVSDQRIGLFVAKGIGGTFEIFWED